MSDTYLDQVYKISGDDAKRDLYDKWSGSYDADLEKEGYATPARLADALAGVTGERTAPILDFGCGTGLAGEMLSKRGFEHLDGCDPAEEMLAQARDKGLYRTLWRIKEGAPLDVAPGTYAAIVASGVISKGAAPPETFDLISGLLQPGQFLAFSYNSHTTDDAAYMGKLDALLSGGFAPRFAEDGPHLPGIGLTSMVYVLEKTAP